MSLILPKSDIMLSSTPYVSEYTKGLSQLGITMFSYTRAYDDGSFIDISDRADMIDYYYYQTDMYKHYTPDVNPHIIGNGFLMLTSADIASSPLAPIRDDLNLDNSFSIIKKCETYHEIWNYASSKDNHAIINFYLNNIGFIESFSFGFKENMRDLIVQYENDKMRRSLPDTTDHLPIAANHKHVKHTGLSHRQLQCAHLLIKGMSYKQIANILELSPRSVELYISIMKNKLGCRTKSELIICLMSMINP